MKRTIQYSLLALMVTIGTAGLAQEKLPKEKVKASKEEKLKERHKGKHKNKATKLHYKANQERRKSRA